MNSSELTKMIRARLDLFEAGRVPLHQLVGDLRSIQDSFSSPTPEWINEFDRLRFGLEEVNAIRLADGNTSSELHEELVRSTVRRIKELLPVDR